LIWGRVEVEMNHEIFSALQVSMEMGFDSYGDVNGTVDA
jgi:hypothetical protein